MTLPVLLEHVIPHHLQVLSWRSAVCSLVPGSVHLQLIVPKYSNLYASLLNCSWTISVLHWDLWLLVPTFNIVLSVFMFSLILHRSLFSLLSLIKGWTELCERQDPVGNHLIFASILTENIWQVFWEVLSNCYFTQFIAIWSRPCFPSLKDCNAK